MWIIGALALSVLPLLNKKIEPAFYIWLLLPIDSYGISIAGATIKPYMIFAFALPLILYAQNKGNTFDLSASKGQLVAGIISVLMVTINFINNDDPASVKASLLTVIVYLCAQFCASTTNCEKIDQLCEVFVASCFGCGIIYFLSYLCLQNGIGLETIVAETREDIGLFMQTNNMVEGVYTETLRMRGFAYDPNLISVQFIFGISACVLSMFKKFKFYHLFTLIISIVCIILSDSRTGLICAILSIVITSVVCIVRFDSVKKKIAYFALILGGCSGFLVAAMTPWGQSKLNSLLSAYSDRSGLTDEYGRFSIWKECFQVYWQSNPILGVGFNNMRYLTATNRSPHNTWLGFLCECGLIVGGIAIVYFITVMIIGWVKMRHHQNKTQQNSAYLCLVIGYTVTIITLISVDNINCNYLWFGALLILKLASYKPKAQTLTS